MQKATKLSLNEENNLFYDLHPSCWQSNLPFHEPSKGYTVMNFLEYFKVGLGRMMIFDYIFPRVGLSYSVSTTSTPGYLTS